MSGYKDSIVYVITHDVRAQDYDEFIEAKLQHIHLHALFQGKRLSTFRQFCIYLQSNSWLEKVITNVVQLFPVKCKENTPCYL